MLRSLNIITNTLSILYVVLYVLYFAIHDERFAHGQKLRASVIESLKVSKRGAAMIRADFHARRRDARGPIPMSISWVAVESAVIWPEYESAAFPY